MRWQEWVAFTGLCLLAASRWLMGPAGVAPPAVERQALALSAIALIAAVSFLTGKSRPRRLFRSRRMAALGSLLYFTLPSVLLERSREYASDVTVSTVFALAPVAVLLVWGAASRDGLKPGRLVAPLAGLGGVLLLLPYELPVSARGWESVAEVFVAMFLVAYASVLLHQSLKSSFAESLVLVGAGNAAVLLGFCWIHKTIVWRLNAWSAATMVATALDAASIALTVWLLRTMNPVRFSARFLAIPLVTIVEGLILVRPGFSGRLLAGMILLTAGAGWLLASGQAVDEEILTLR